MYRPHLFWRGCAMFALACLTFAFGYPIAFIATHGWSASGWPSALHPSPTEWLNGFAQGIVLSKVGTYVEMATGTCDALPWGGAVAAFVMGVGLAIATPIVVFGGRLVFRRDPSGLHGSTDWASLAERRPLNKGIEIGLNPETRRPVRVALEGNLMTIAPPRSGKTAGFLIPNLVYADENAWSGPAVVIDPKGDAFRAVKRRREEMGRTVRCIDPLDFAGGRDRWNPLVRIDPKDTLYLQSMARALLPNTGVTSNSSEFFTISGVDLLVGAFRATMHNGRPDPVSAARLLHDTPRLHATLQSMTDDAAHAARAILDMDERTRSQIQGTARQATQWLIDQRMQTAVSDHTFELSDLRAGNVDLFIVVPADDRKLVLAPYMRWLLADLFQTVRERRPDRRIVTFIDEANVLGRFDALKEACGELPGSGMSLWTFWQTRSQIVDHYGPEGADTFLGTAQMLNIFGLPRQLPKEQDYWSEAIGRFTALTTTTGRDGSGRVTVSSTAEARQLVAATDLSSLLSKQQVAFLAQNGFTSNPMKLRRTLGFKDWRFAGLIDRTRPVGRMS